MICSTMRSLSSWLSAGQPSLLERPDLDPPWQRPPILHTGSGVSGPGTAASPAAPLSPAWGSDHDAAARHRDHPEVLLLVGPCVLLQRLPIDSPLDWLGKLVWRWGRRERRDAGAGCVDCPRAAGHDGTTRRAGAAP